MTNNSKQYTNEMRRKFVRHIWKKIDSWAENDDMSEREKLEGLAFSILVMLDGCVPGLPQWILAPYEKMSERDVMRMAEDTGSIAGILHEVFYAARGDIEEAKDYDDKTAIPL